MQNALDGLHDSLAAVPESTWKDSRSSATIVSELHRLKDANAYLPLMQFAMVCLTDLFQAHFPLEDRRVLALARHLRDVKCMGDRRRGLPVPVELPGGDEERLRAGMRMVMFMQGCECKLLAKMKES